MDNPPWQDTVEQGHLAIALIRHGQTAWNAERRFLGASDIPLDPVGQDQARQLGDRFQGVFDRVYTSPLSRARQTAEQLTTSPEPIEAFRELRQGELEGLRGHEALARFPLFFAQWKLDPSDVTVPGGESLSRLQTRAIEALGGIAGRHPEGGVVAVVTHQMVIATLTCWVVGEPLRRWRHHGVKNTAVTVLAYDRQNWVLKASGWLP